MTVLYGTLAVLFVIEVAAMYWPWRFNSTTQLAATLVAATGWSLLFAETSIKLELLMALAISGGSLVLHSAYRLVRAWADRVEVANVLPIRRGQM